MDIRAAENPWEQQQFFKGKNYQSFRTFSEGGGEFGNMFRCKKRSLQADLSTELRKASLLSGSCLRMLYLRKSIAIGGFLLSLEKIRSGAEPVESETATQKIAMP
jgi:hypothetical protein